MPNSGISEKQTTTGDDLTGKNILVIEALSGGAALVREALRSGVNVTVVSSGLPDCQVPDDIAPLVRIIEADTTDATSVIQKALPVHEANAFDAVFPGCDAFVPAAALVANEFGVRGHDVTSVEQLQSKYEMRRALHDVGVRTPWFVAVNESTDEATLEAISFPAVVKPFRGSGSWHVRRVDNGAELNTAIQAILDDRQLDMGFSAGADALVEEYLAGPEYSVEGYVNGGHVTLVAVTEKMLGPEPFFVEVGHIVPADLPAVQVSEIESYLNEVVRAVGLSWGVFHAEVRLTDAGPVLIEIGARLGGDQIWDLVQRATGVDLPHLWMRDGLKLPLGEQCPRESDDIQIAAIRFIAPEGEGSVLVIDGLDKVKAMPGVVEAIQTVPSGHLLSDAQDFSSRIGYVKLAVESRSALQTALAQIDADLDVILEGVS